jgi:hypothetical protein
MKTLKLPKFLPLLLLVLFVSSTYAQQPITDHDNDGVEDSVDLDDDNDGILDTDELKWGNQDFDGDGIPNHLDLDSDNDGITDATENMNSDINGDGIIDGFMDENGDGMNDSPITLTAQLDVDADGLPNFLDSDSDNDGIPDAIAAGGKDDNHDGRLDDYRDVDYDGLSDVVDGDIGNMLAPGDASITSSSRNILNTASYFKELTRLARSCEDIDIDGLCDCYDGDLGNELKLGYDFDLEEL